PMLLYSALRGSGISVYSEGPWSCDFGTESGHGFGPAENGSFWIEPSSLAKVTATARSLRRDDLLIAIARPTGQSDDPLPLGLAGGDFHGDLSSDSTRMNGYVLSTDVAPTILEHFGIDAPSQMSGQPIRTEGSIDPAGIESLASRMAVISGRRGPVI